MKRTALAPVLAVSLVASLGAALSARAARPGDTAVVSSGGYHENAATRTGGSAGRDPTSDSSRIIATAQMRDITLRVDRRRQGLGAFSDTWGDSLVFDKNHDGNPDVLLSFHNSRGRSGWGTAAAGSSIDRSLPSTDRHNCATADFAGPAGRLPDGRADLYCVRGANIGTVSDKKNALLIQQPGGGFKDVVTCMGCRGPFGARPNGVDPEHPRRCKTQSVRGQRGARSSPESATTSSSTGAGGSWKDAPADCPRCRTPTVHPPETSIRTAARTSCHAPIRCASTGTARLPDGPVSYREVAARQGSRPSGGGTPDWST